ncbi:MAG: dicarboxylate/amino acid:cation symporter [Pirellulaceae bacterium]
MQLYTKILLGMLIGVVLGLLVGPNSFLLPQDGVDLMSNAKVLDQPDGQEVAAAKLLKTAKLVDPLDKDAQWLKIRWSLTSADILKLRETTNVQGLKAGKKLEGWVRNEPASVQSFASWGRTLVDWTEWIGRLFLALIKMVVVPLVFFSLVVGVASLGDFRALGRLGGRTIAYFTLTTVIALVIGMGIANIVQPGKLLGEDDRNSLLASYEGSVGDTVNKAVEAPSLVDQIVGIVPTNPFQSLASGDMLQVIFFALMVGIALTMMNTDHAQPVVDLFARLNDAMVMLVHIAMALAPVGVAALLFKVVGSTGLSVLAALGVYCLVVVAGLAVHLFLTYGSVIRFGAKLPVFGFLGAIKEALLMAFSTSSSSATLPVNCWKRAKTTSMSAVASPRLSCPRCHGQYGRDGTVSRRGRIVYRSDLRYGLGFCRSSHDCRIRDVGVRGRGGRSRRWHDHISHGADGCRRSGGRSGADPGRGPTVRHVSYHVECGGRQYGRCLYGSLGR